MAVCGRKRIGSPNSPGLLPRYRAERRPSRPQQVRRAALPHAGARRAPREHLELHAVHLQLLLRGRRLPPARGAGAEEVGQRARRRVELGLRLPRGEAEPGGALAKRRTDLSEPTLVTEYLFSSRSFLPVS